jgi:hypothetical protein
MPDHPEDQLNCARSLRAICEVHVPDIDVGGAGESNEEMAVDFATRGYIQAQNSGKYLPDSAASSDLEARFCHRQSDCSRDVRVWLIS